ncbi:ATP-binding protein [Bacillus salitolerans]|uniref:histidine kinase n=1 Tax=Bacillus salitolerans TaxID=1437434 RepID=A0ABW4LU29_9BACI
MPSDIKDLLLNLFFVISLPLIFHFLFEKRFRGIANKQLFTVVCALSIITVVFNPVEFDDGIMYDLRQIPIWLGSLYGGPISSAILITTLLLVRSFFGGDGIVIAMIISVLQLVIVFFFWRRFLNLNTSQKVLTATALTFMSSTGSILLLKFLYDYDTDISITVKYVLVQTIGMTVMSYLFETLTQNIYLREELLRSEKMKVVSHLASSISHEVRNPLTVVRGFIQLLYQEEVPWAKQRDYLKVSMDEIDRADKIIRDYLTFAKPAPEQSACLNLATEIEHSVNVVMPLANLHGVSINMKLFTEYVVGDSAQVQQCIINILKNSIEAMANGGTLDITMNRLNLYHFQIEIADTGTGMSEEQVRRLGEPYFTTKGVKGTGLGMMVVFRIIEALNGSIHVESELNKGTKMIITFSKNYAGSISHEQLTKHVQI